MDRRPAVIQCCEFTEDLVVVKFRCLCNTVMEARVYRSKRLYTRTLPVAAPPVVVDVEWDVQDDLMREGRVTCAVCLGGVEFGGKVNCGGKKSMTNLAVLWN